MMGHVYSGPLAEGLAVSIITMASSTFGTVLDRPAKLEALDRVAPVQIGTPHERPSPNGARSLAPATLGPLYGQQAQSLTGVRGEDSLREGAGLTSG